MKPSNDDLLDYILARLREGPRFTQDQIQRNDKKFKHRGIVLFIYFFSLIYVGVFV